MEEGSSVTDVTDVTDGRRKFGNGLCNGWKEEGRRFVVRNASPLTFMRTKVLTTNLITIFQGHVTVAKTDKM
jgi:Tol biopolymer transport system component